MKRRTFLYTIIIIFFIIIAFGISTYFFIRSKTPEEIFNFPVIKNTIIKKAGQDKKELVDLLPQFLGFQKAQTYLIIFANNTELRPGGGFMGTYATVRVTDGKMETLAVEGTEVLDKRTPATWKPQPPKILQDKLGVDRWYFRDSNWSPDYPTDVKKALELYKAEGGVAADDIDAVITFTPSVLEKLLEITGPLKIEGVEFTSQNVVRQLEQEVEYSYRDKGIPFENRKKIIDPFFHELLRKLAPDALLHSEKYFALFDDLAKQKQVLAYFFDEKVQKIMKEKKWTGEVQSPSGDFIMWVDANLGALKTDEALQRQLSYSILTKKVGVGRSFSGDVKMKYIHTGVFDKFTSRYRTYARVYVPVGSTLEQVNSIDQNGKRVVITQVDQGKELGKQWFGVFFTIEPQETKELEFVYTLAPSVSDQIKGGVYSLLTQKQAGMENSTLTLDLDFGTNIQSASPGEQPKEWGDSHYKLSSPYLFDQLFDIKI